MARTITPLRQRVRDAGLTPTAVGSALSMEILIDRVLDGAESGPSYEKVVAYLDRIEKTGEYVPAAALTDQERTARAQAAAQEAYEAPLRMRREAQERLDAYQAAEREAILQARAIATAKYVSAAMDRISLGMALREIREDAGLGLNEVAALIGTVDASHLDRLERGKLLGVRDMGVIESVYRTLPKFTGKRKVVAK
jgi:hypothetical protein